MCWQNAQLLGKKSSNCTTRELDVFVYYSVYITYFNGIATQNSKQVFPLREGNGSWCSLLQSNGKTPPNSFAWKEKVHLQLLKISCMTFGLVIPITQLSMVHEACLKTGQYHYILFPS